MEFEVEVKFPVTSSEELLSRLAVLNVNWVALVHERDIYFQHPCRDFGQTDEALRLRQTGDDAFVTYKGPKTDPATKTRLEIDIPLAGSATALPKWQELFRQLGFQPVAEVVKSRRRGFVDWRGKKVQVCVDQVEGLGCFLELELSASNGEIQAARELVLSLAERLGFGRSERRSYLELLLEKKAGKFPPPSHAP